MAAGARRKPLLESGQLGWGLLAGSGGADSITEEIQASRGSGRGGFARDAAIQREENRRGSCQPGAGSDSGTAIHSLPLCSLGCPGRQDSHTENWDSYTRSDERGGRAGDRRTSAGAGAALVHARSPVQEAAALRRCGTRCGSRAASPPRPQTSAAREEVEGRRARGAGCETLPYVCAGHGTRAVARGLAAEAAAPPI